MNEINNMGGMLLAELLFVDQIELFAVIDDQAIIKTKSDPKKLSLPIVSISASPVVVPETTDAGTIYKSTATIRLTQATLGYSLFKMLRNINVRGCVLLYGDANGNKKVVGSNEYPLFGTLTLINGSKATDFSGYEISLTGKTLHPQLPYLIL